MSDIEEKIDVCPNCHTPLMWTPTSGIDTFYCPRCDKCVVFYRRVTIEVAQ